MSAATDRTAAEFDVAGVAHVSFRVRAETLGHGEEVFLVVQSTGTSPPTSGPSPSKAKTASGPSSSNTHNLAQEFKTAVPLYTTASRYPWYHTASPLTIPLARPEFNRAAPASSGPSAPTPPRFVYHYAIHRAGVFHRWEQPSDGPTELVQEVSNSAGTPEIFHQLPLHLLANRESYVVNDVLGTPMGHPDIDHIRLPHQHNQNNPGHHHSGPSGGNAKAQADTLHNTPTKPDHIPSVVDPKSPTTAGHHKHDHQRHVGFAPSPQPYKISSVVNNPVHLNSSDGLVVVSVFLPVFLHRSNDGRWSADWDYEMLLSMQTHLRVTRVGVVKWRGWHGNSGADGSPEAGVPRQERHLVEECLRPFHCIPVWIDPGLFGDMYNGFCKGVLWPVLHNVTSVYSSRPDDYQVPQQQPGSSADTAMIDTTIMIDARGRPMMGGTPIASAAQQFAEYSMDDVEQGHIHGGRGKEADLWSAYNTVNRQFADAVVQNFNEGDLVWIHGFHLLILPSYLTRRVPMAKVGIFLHTPFPSSEIFRTLWCREDLLRGMLNADQVGFHLFEYARHFLTSCRRLLGLNYGMIPDPSGGHTLAIDTNGRSVVVTSIHAGVEPPVLRQVLTHSTTVQRASNLRARFQGKHIWCAIDRLESLKGIPLKLLALERFLTRCKEWVGRIVLIQVGIQAFERGDDYLRTEHEVTKLVQSINNKFPGTIQLQICQEAEMRLHQRMALLRAADMVVVTSIRDGLNLLPLEYTIAHQDAVTEMGRKDGRKRGLCVLSEFASCTRVMRGALHVNPWKISQIANAFHQALNMTEDERLRRIRIASEFVTRVTTQRWALAVMLDLKGVHKNINPVQVSGAGLGLGYRILGMNTGFVSLDTSVVAKAYRNAKNRLILLDYGGTIVNNDNLDNLLRFKMVKERSAPSNPTSRMIEAIKGLCEDKKNTVFVVSGKERHSLTRTMGAIPNLGLAAEHGMFISWPTARDSPKRRWETLVPETDRTWRSLAVTIMEVYTSRTHGSYIEETEMKVLWQYRDADTEFGSLQAKELEDHLSKYLRSFPVDILHGGIREGGYVEVRPKGVNKGVLAMRALRRMSERCDFSLVVGDDHCDEPMLSVMRQIGRRVVATRRELMGQDPLPDMPLAIQMVDVSSCDNAVSPDLEVYTTTVGKKPSAAANYLHDVDQVQELLESLVKVSARSQFNSDLRPSRSDAQLSTGLSPQPVVMELESSPSMAKSVSLSQLEVNPATSAKIRPLSDFLGLGTIEDEEDDDAFYF